jgi:hypothetical protein
VVNGPLRGAKERRSFKPKVAGSTPVGRIPFSSVLCRFLALAKGISPFVPKPSSAAFRPRFAPRQRLMATFGYIIRLVERLSWRTTGAWLLATTFRTVHAKSCCRRKEGRPHSSPALLPP